MSDSNHLGNLAVTAGSAGSDSFQSAAPLWTKLIVLLSAVLLAVGAMVALFDPRMLVSAQEPINGAVRVYAGYLASRNLAMALMLLGLLILRARVGLASLMVLVALVQVFDAFMDLAEGRWTIVPGVLVLGILLLIAANRLLRSSLHGKKP